jgi:heterodisulfide reductase subunit B
VEFVDIKEFNCCGYPLKNIDYKAHILCSTRNLALAEREGLDILTFCNCCFSTLKRVNHYLHDEAPLKEEINASLAGDGLEYQGEVRVRHLLEVLYEDIGVDSIRERLVRNFSGLKIATHYGCHILRPKEIMQFDNPIAPTIFDRLVELTGAESIPWAKKLNCCGSAMQGIDDELSMDLAESKITDARQSGANYMCTACPYCQLQFDRTQRLLVAQRNGVQPLPAILFTQLLGLSLGLDDQVLGLQKNELDTTGITKFLQ